MNVYVRDLSRALTALDLKVDVFTRSTGELRVIDEAPGMRVIGIPGCRTGTASKNEIADMVPALIRGIEGLVQREHVAYDVVHSHYWISGMAGRALATRWDVPHVQMFHTLSRIKSKFAGSPPDPRRERNEMRLLQTSDAVVVSNLVERREIGELYPDWRARLVSIPCGIDLSRFHRTPRHSSPDDRFTIVALGRLERLKNFGLLLDALALACRESAEFRQAAHLSIAGGPSADERDERRRLEAQVRALGIEHLVRFEGPIPPDQLPEFYASAGICVVPSLHESFGLVALEAMASGLPVVATRTGGMQMTVQHGASGFLVDPIDPADMAQRLLTLWRSPLMREHMGMRGARAARDYSWPVVAEQVACLYESLIRGHASSRSVPLEEAELAGT
jgi:D-inositol-3-phosphate glycosyltransferase